MPRVSPAAVSKAMEAAEQEVLQEAPRKLKSTGPAKEALEKPSVVEPVESAHIDPEWAENMEFNREKITVRLLDSTDQNAEKTVRVWNNGDPMDFPRGVEVTCERRFVETLARAKPTTFTQKAVMDEHGGPRDYMNISHRALRYPFTVVRDDNKVGQAWLKAVVAQQ